MRMIASMHITETPTRASRPSTVAGLAVVLDGLALPAHRWEIVMHAEHYGADRSTRSMLASLPDGRYEDLPAVARVPLGQSNQVVGAVGVSGGSGVQDQTIAAMAAAAF